MDAHIRCGKVEELKEIIRGSQKMSTSPEEICTSIGAIIFVFRKAEEQDPEPRIAKRRVLGPMLDEIRLMHLDVAGGCIRWVKARANPFLLL